MLHTDEIPSELPILLIQFRTAGISTGTTVLTAAPAKDDNDSKKGGK